MEGSPTIVTVESFGFDGVLPLWGVLALGALLLAGTIYWAKKDIQYAKRSKAVWALAALRLTAVGVLLWMLAGPVRIATATSEWSQSLPILVDRSASMSLVDPIDESGNNAQWAAWNSRDKAFEPLNRLNTAYGNLLAAQHCLNRLLEESNSSNLDNANQWIEQAVANVRSGGESLGRLDAISFSGAALKKESFQGMEDVLSRRVLAVLTPYTTQSMTPELRRDPPLRDASKALSAQIRILHGWLDQTAGGLEASGSEYAGSGFMQGAVRSRMDQAREWLDAAENSWMPALEERLKILRYEFGESAVPLASPVWKRSLEEDQPAYFPSTSLGEALGQVARDRLANPVMGAVLVTDGGHNAGRDPLEVCSALKDTPLYIVPIGNTRMERDVLLHHTSAPKAIIQNDILSVEAMVTAYDCEGESLRVVLKANGQVVDEKTVRALSDIHDGRLRLRWKAETLGMQRMTLECIPVSDERTEENNAETFTVKVMEDKIRVLISDNMPRWEFRYLINLFNRDEDIEFEQLIFEPRHDRSGRASPMPSFPYRLEDWSRYRVVILGDLRPAQLSPSHQELLRRYVSEMGGNLIVIAGRESMPQSFADQPLVQLLPVEPQDRRLNPDQARHLELTVEGRINLSTQLAENEAASEEIWREMSRKLPLYRISDYSQPKPTSHVLISAPAAQGSRASAGGKEPAFLSWHFVGNGRVVYLSAPVTYQLRYRQGDVYHHRFWGQLLRWAIARDLDQGSRTVRLSTDKNRYDQGESVDVRARLYRLDGRPVTGANCKLTATQEGNVMNQLALTEDPERPGDYRATLQARETGALRLRLEGDMVERLLALEDYKDPVQTVVHIDPSGALELRHPLCDLALLRQMAEMTGGKIVPPSSLETLLSQIPSQVHTSESVRRQPLWNRWDLFWIFIGCLVLEWIGRKRLGLV